MFDFQGDANEGEAADLIPTSSVSGLMDLHYGQVDMILHSAPVTQCRI